VALHQAMDALHCAMRIALYRTGGLVIKIVIDLPAYFVIVDSVVTNNHS
jgi:hypothetical protein